MTCMNLVANWSSDYGTESKVKSLRLLVSFCSVKIKAGLASFNSLKLL